MKRKKRFWMITAAVITLLAVASVGIAVAADMTKNNQANNSANGDVVYLAEDTVKKLALNHAGLTEADVTELKVVLDYDDRKAEYEVKFRKDNVKYEYEIDAVSGTILSYDAESKKVLQNSTPAEDTTVTYITDVDTKKENQSTAGDAPAATPTTPAATPATTPSTATYITQEAAKEVAFNHAGLTEADVTRVKIELDYDDGQAEYEVEFRVGQVEYEYEINAVTGSIICFEKDIDD